MRVLLVALLSLISAVCADVTPAAAYDLQESSILETVDVSGDGGILKLILKYGEGAAASKGQTVNAHYDGKLAADGKQFDSSRKRGQPFSFPLGGGRVIKGW